MTQDSLLQTVLHPYHCALIALAILCLMIFIQGFIGPYFGYQKGKEIPGGKSSGDFSDFGFRAIRTLHNSLENLPLFAVPLFLAIIGGADPQWVNGLAVGYVIARALFWAIYYVGIGKVAGGPRSFAFLLAFFLNLALAIVALLALL